MYVRRIAYIFNRAKDPSFGFVTDKTRFINHMRHSGRRNARQFGHVFDANATHARGFPSEPNATPSLARDDAYQPHLLEIGQAVILQQCPVIPMLIGHKTLRTLKPLRSSGRELKKPSSILLSVDRMDGGC